MLLKAQKNLVSEKCQLSDRNSELLSKRTELEQVITELNQLNKEINKTKAELEKENTTLRSLLEKKNVRLAFWYVDVEKLGLMINLVVLVYFINCLFFIHQRPAKSQNFKSQ